MSSRDRRRPTLNYLHYPLPEEQHFKFTVSLLLSCLKNLVVNNLAGSVRERFLGLRDYTYEVKIIEKLYKHNVERISFISHRIKGAKDVTTL